MRRLTYAPKIFLNIITPQGDKIGRFFTPSTTIGMILTSLGYQPGKFKLIYQGKPLPQGDKIGSLGLVNDSELVIKSINNPVNKHNIWRFWG